MQKLKSSWVQNQSPPSSKTVESEGAADEAVWNKVRTVSYIKKLGRKGRKNVMYLSIAFVGHISHRSINSYNMTFTVHNEWEILNMYVECDVLWLLFLLHSSRFLLQFVLQAVRKHVQSILVVHAYISALLMTMSIPTVNTSNFYKKSCNCWSLHRIAIGKAKIVMTKKPWTTVYAFLWVDRRIWYVINKKCFGSGLDLDSIGSVDPDLHWESGSRPGSMQAKIIHIKREKRRILVSSGVWTSFLKDQKKVQRYIFLNFVIKSLGLDPDPYPAKPGSWSRFIKQMPGSEFSLSKSETLAKKFETQTCPLECWSCYQSSSLPPAAA